MLREPHVNGSTTIDVGGTVNIGHRDEAIGVHVLPDGKIVFAGTTIPNEGSRSSDILTGRLNEDGSLDTTYGVEGVSVVDLRGPEQ